MITVTLRGGLNQFPEDDRFLLICCSQAAVPSVSGSKTLSKEVISWDEPLGEGALEGELSQAAPTWPLLPGGRDDCPHPPGSREARLGEGRGERGGLVGGG